MAWWSCGLKYSRPPGDVDDIDYGDGDGGDVDLKQHACLCVKGLKRI